LKNLETLAEHLTALKNHIDILNEFLNRKKKIEKATRIDLRKIDEAELIRKYLGLEKNTLAVSASWTFFS